MEIGTERTRDKYRNGHPLCLRSFVEDGVWRFCWSPTRSVHEIVGRRGPLKFARENLFTLCGTLARDCHKGFAHREANPEETEGEIRRDLFAVKYIIGEAKLDDTEILMRETDRSWWTKDLPRGITFADWVDRRANDFWKGGLDRWVKSWITYSREKV